MIKNLNIVLSTFCFQLIAFSLLLTACSSENYVGDKEQNGLAIAFDSNAGVAVTRATNTGETAASALGKKFFIYGTKTLSSGNQQVFPGYEVDYTANTAGTTTTNTANWEYVGKGSADQTIKYWDFGASQYDFAAYSLGTAEPAATVDATGMFTSDWKLNGLKFTGSSSQLFSCYMTDKQSMTPSASQTQVTMQFFSLGCKVRIGIYENLTGYSVKDVKFYLDDNEGTASTTTPCLFASQPLVYDGGSYTITYDTNDKAQAAGDFTAYTGTNNATFGSLTNYTTAEKSEGSGDYIGRTSNQCTLAPYLSVLPHTVGADLHFKVDYKLVSTDGKQTLDVEGVSAVVPAAYADWKPNFAYTYIFKINNTDSSLQPITFDAYAVADQTGANQGTITTFGTYSITTHQEGDVEGDNVFYVTDKNIEVTAILGDGSNSTKIALADVSKNTTTDYVIIYHQQSPYETDIETTTSTSTTPVDGVYKETIESISDGKVFFSPDKTGTYRVEYWHRTSATATPECRAIKVVLVGDKTGTPSTNGAFTGDDLEEEEVE